MCFNSFDIHVFFKHVSLSFLYRNPYSCLLVLSNMSTPGNVARELRARAVEWNKPLPIIRDIADLEDDEMDEDDLAEAGLTSDFAAVKSNGAEHKSGGSKVPEFHTKEIFIPTAQPLAVDLKEAGIEFAPISIDRTTAKRHIRWRGFMDAQGNPIREEDPLSVDVSYHLYIGDFLLLREINKFKPLITQEDYRKSFDTWEKATSTGPLMEQSRAIDLAVKRGIDCAPHVLNEVYKAWVFRRQQVKRPLMRLFWPIGVAGDEPPTSTSLRFRAAAKMRLRRPRRNNDDLLHRAGIAKRDAKNAILLVHRLVVRERLKLARVQLANAIANPARPLDALIASANGLLAEPFVQDETLLIDSHHHVRTKLLMVSESPRAGGGMLGGLPDGAPHGTVGASYLESQRVKTRVRHGRSNRIYIDRVKECEKDAHQFLPNFAQWDISNDQQNEESLDELHEITKAVRAAVFQLSADSLPSLAQTCDSNDTLLRDIEWFKESWKAYSELEQRIRDKQPLEMPTSI